MAAPAAILWTDAEGQFAPLLPRLKDSLPEPLTLGAYDPMAKTGPAIWLRMMVDRPVEGAKWPEGRPPIVYLPGFSRADLRAGETCPEPIRPLAELQYRGTVFSHPNGKDWTVVGFLQNAEQGLGFDAQQSEGTQQAALRALLKLADTRVADLRGRTLRAEDFEDLQHPDAVSDLLRWMSDPDTMRSSWSPEGWESFEDLCPKRYGFDPEKDGALAAAERLGSGAEKWPGVWSRFAEAPDRYPGIPDLLRQARPPRMLEGLFGQPQEVRPQDNEEQETRLREELSRLDSVSPEDARAALVRLDGEHGTRRRWVWSRLGQAPLARAAGSLSELAKATERPLGGTSLDAIASSYVGSGWRADAAVLDALASVSAQPDVEAVGCAVDAVYRPWLERGATSLQSALGGGLPWAALPVPSAGECILFVDGLRLDLAHRLSEALTGYESELGWRLAPVPSVTPTAKPAVSPVAGQLGGEAEGGDFTPSVAGTGKRLDTQRFRKLLEQQGIQVLEPTETGAPDGVAWSETGRFDKLGHSEGWRLARRVSEEVAAVADRVKALLEAGWGRVRIVTDHGWLLLPTALPRCELPGYLAELRWGRCAVLRESTTSDLPLLPWYWNASVTIAVAPGISCFVNGLCYAHGGISPQESIVPTLTVRSAGGRALPVAIESVRWVGLRCRIAVANGSGLSVDLRSKQADPASSIAQETRTVDQEGQVALVVGDDSLAGTAAHVVVLGHDGKPAASQLTTVGG